MIKLLSLETATDRGSFCLWSGEETANAPLVLAARTESCPPGQPHAETLLPLLRRTLNETGWSLPELNAIVVDAGPGMFTGLRVSAALAQGLAVASGKPIISISSLEALAESAYVQTSRHRVVTLLDARMQQIYAAAWERSAEGNWRAIIPPCLVNPDALDSLPLDGFVAGMGVDLIAVAGTALDEYPETARWCAAKGLQDSGVRYPEAAAVAALGARHLVRGARQDPAEAVPLYVRDRVALTTAERAAGLSL
jgi:tRNA threonylcarbamoyladenosine biosynthesis protein TsaB